MFFFFNRVVSSKKVVCCFPKDGYVYCQKFFFKGDRFSVFEGMWFFSFFHLVSYFVFATQRDFFSKWFFLKKKFFFSIDFLFNFFQCFFSNFFSIFFQKFFISKVFFRKGFSPKTVVFFNGVHFPFFFSLGPWVHFHEKVLVCLIEEV